jgi:hypothetical protein
MPRLEPQTGSNTITLLVRCHQHHEFTQLAIAVTDRTGHYERHGWQWRTGHLPPAVQLEAENLLCGLIVDAIERTEGIAGLLPL